MCADLETSPRFVNNEAKKAERDYPGPLHRSRRMPIRSGGAEALKELNRCKHEARLPGRGDHVGRPTGLFLDDEKFEPFWTEVARLGMWGVRAPGAQAQLFAAVQNGFR